jgi:RNA polymerase sigma-70 factor, ECF subfamily
VDEFAMSEQDRAKRFQELAVPHLHAAYNLARWLIRNDQDAEDIVQEAYLRAFRFFDGFRGDDSRAWVLAVVRNTAYTWLKQNRGHETLPFDEDARLEQGSATAPEQPYGDPEAVLARHDDRRLLDRALEALPLEFREVLVLRELEELSYREIASIAGIPIGTVMSRLARSRKLLAQCFGKLDKESCDGLQRDPGTVAGPRGPGAWSA